MIELERKFVVAKPPPWLERTRMEPIDQAYLAVSGEWEFRVRRLGGRTVLTVKHGSGERRLEEEVEITEEQFDSLRPLADAAITKQRHYLNEGEVTIEVDVYEGSLDGLVVAEVEFDSQRAADSFEPPDWFGEEVTGDRRYANQQLAREGLPRRGDGRIRTSAR